MPSVTRTVTFDAPIDAVYNVIVDYARYPEFVDGCDSTNILNFDENGARVEYGLNLIKKFKYILSLNHQRPNKVSWSFEEGDIFKKNEGSWQLKDIGNGKTEVQYDLTVEVKGFAPGALVRGLTEKNLPAMLEAYHNEAKKRA